MTPEQTEPKLEVLDPGLLDPPSGAQTVRGSSHAILKQLWSFLIALFLISVITFVATNAIGIDVARKVLGRQVTEERLEAYREEYHLNDPPVQRYVAWVGDFATGNWGLSPLTRRPVKEEVLPRLGRTVALTLCTLAIALPVAFPFGVALARRPGSRADLFSSMGLVVLAAIPWFVIGILLIFLFAVHLRWFPIDSRGLSFGTNWQKVMAYALPALTLAITLLPHIVRMVRSAVLSTLAAPYTRSAVLLGLPRRTITRKYLIPNAAAPIVNVITLEIIWLLGGVIVVEEVFGFPGLGNLLIEAIRSGDLVTVQAISVVCGIMFLSLNFLADLVVLRLTPRLREAT